MKRFRLFVAFAACSLGVLSVAASKAYHWNTIQAYYEPTSTTCATAIQTSCEEIGSGCLGEVGGNEVQLYKTFNGANLPCENELNKVSK